MEHAACGRRAARRRLRLLVLAAGVVPRPRGADRDGRRACGRRLTLDGERWLAECAATVLGAARPAAARPPSSCGSTEAAMAAVGGIRPKSTFQIGGAGSVGTGSVRGWPALVRLREAGFAIWPFDQPACAAGRGGGLPAGVHRPGGEVERVGARRSPRRALPRAPAGAARPTRSRARTRSTPRCRRSRCRATSTRCARSPVSTTRSAAVRVGCGPPQPRRTSCRRRRPLQPRDRRDDRRLERGRDVLVGRVRVPGERPPGAARPRGRARWSASCRSSGGRRGCPRRRPPRRRDGCRLRGRGSS